MLSNRVIAITAVVLSECYSLEVSERTVEESQLILSLAHHFYVSSITFISFFGEGLSASQHMVFVQRYASNRHKFTVTCRQVNVPEIGTLYVVGENFRELTDGALNSQTIWLTFVTGDCTLEEHFHDVPIAFDCQVLVAHKKYGHSYTITEVYRVGPHLPLQMRHFGNWTSADGFFVTNFGLFDRRNDMQGLILRGAVKEGPANSILQEHGNKIIKIGSFIGNIWNILEEALNFTTSFYKAADNAFGVKDANGSWNGMLGMVQRGEIDVITTDILMNSPRMDVVSFMDPLFEVRTYMLIRNPDKLDMSWDSFVKPFHARLWKAVLGVMLVLAVCFHIAAVVEARCRGRITTHSKLRFYDSILYIYYTFCQQAQSEPAVCSLSCRIVSLSASLTAVVLLVGYSGFLISYLTFRTQSLPFTSFEGFLEDRTYRLGVLSNSIHYAYFKESSHPAMHQVFHDYIQPNNKDHPKSFLEGLQRACVEDNYAFMGPVFILNGFLAKLSCHLVAIPEAVIPATATIAIDNHSNFKGLLSHYIQKLRRSGILKKLREEFLSNNLPKLESTLKAVDIHAVEPILGVLFFGIALAITILVAEIVYSRRQEFRKKNS